MAKEYAKLDIGYTIERRPQSLSGYMMKITVTEAAHDWYVDEIGLKKGDGIRFFGKIYGSTEVHDNFSVGINVGTPVDPLSTETVGGITYFIEKSDEWFFSGYNFKVDYNDQLQEVSYHFNKE